MKFFVAAAIAAVPVLLALAVAGAAFVLRYTPVQGTGLEVVTVWDRWKQRVCIISLAQENRLICDLEELR